MSELKTMLGNGLLKALDILIVISVVVGFAGIAVFILIFLHQQL